LKLSIVSPTWNSADRLRVHIESVRQQTFHDFEHIFIDNLSTDDTPEIILSYQKSAGYPVIHIREKDGGLYEAMNKGIRKARGEWVHIFNSDNTYSNPTILEQVFSRDLTSHDVIICGVEILSPDSDPSSSVFMRAGYDPARNFYQTPHQGLLFRRDFYDRHGLYDERFKIISDSIYIFKNCPKGNCLVVDLLLAKLPRGGISGRRSLRNLWESAFNLLFYDPAPFARRFRSLISLVLQYTKYGLLGQKE
jgi:glycosyltransferase